MQFTICGVGERFVPYDEGLALQRDTHARVVAGDMPDTVLLLEHEAVYTAGKRTEESERPADGTPVIDVDRGGKITWHGPGQLIGYPIVRLDEPIDVVGYVRKLEDVLIRVLDEYGIPSRRVEGRSGVWVTELGRDAKIGAIGIRVASGVTMHGFALNCSNSLDAYEKIIACGIRDAGTTTMTRLLGRMVQPADVVESVRRHFTAVFEPGVVRVTRDESNQDAKEMVA